MDEYRPHATDKTANANGGAPAGARPASGRSEAKDQPQGGVEKQPTDVKNVAAELIDKAKSAAGDVLTSVKEDLGQAGSGRSPPDGGAGCRRNQSRGRLSFA